jgi:hypothetical protein
MGGDPFREVDLTKQYIAPRPNIHAHSYRRGIACLLDGIGGG